MPAGTETAVTFDKSGNASQFEATDQFPLAPPFQVESGRTMTSAVVATVAPLSM